eukprot:gene2688-15436_t
MANIVLTFDHLEPECQPKEHPGACTSGERIMEMLVLQKKSSVAAQGVCCLFACLFLLLFNVAVWKLHIRVAAHIGRKLCVRPVDPSPR